MGSIIANNITLNSSTNVKTLQTSAGNVPTSGASGQVRLRNGATNSGNITATDVFVTGGSVNNGNIVAARTTIDTTGTNTGSITTPTVILKGVNGGQILGNLRRYPGSVNTGSVSRFVVSSTPEEETYIDEKVGLSLSVSAYYGPNSSAQITYKWQKSSSAPFTSWTDLPSTSNTYTQASDFLALENQRIRCVLTTSADPGAVYVAETTIKVQRVYNNYIYSGLINAGTQVIDKAVHNAAGQISLLGSGFYEFTDGLVRRVETYSSTDPTGTDPKGNTFANAGVNGYYNQYVELLSSVVIDGGPCGVDDQNNPTDGEGPSFFSELYEGYFFLNGLPFTGTVSAARNSRTADTTGTIFSCTTSTETKKFFLGVIVDDIPSHTVDSDGKITVHDSVNFATKGLTSLRFNNVKRVEGDFRINGNSLQYGLYRCVAESITGAFVCSGVAIGSLSNCTPSVGSLDCSYCALTTLKGAPVLTGVAGPGFNCSNNNLTSLQYVPTIPNGASFDCSFNQITSLQHFSAAGNVHNFYCMWNSLTSLQGFNVPGTLQEFDCNRNHPLTSLRYGPTDKQLVSYNCSNLPNLTSLQYLPQSITTLRAENTGITNVNYMPCAGVNFFLGGKMFPVTADQCGVKWVYLNNTRTAEVDFLGAYSTGYFSPKGTLATTYSTTTPQKAIDTGDFYTYANGVPTKVRDGVLWNGASIYYVGGKYKVDGSHSTPTGIQGDLLSLNIADVVFTGTLSLSPGSYTSLGLPSEIGTLIVVPNSLTSVVGTATIGTLIFSGNVQLPESEYNKWNFTSFQLLNGSFTTVSIPNVSGDVLISNTAISSLLSIGNVGGSLTVQSANYGGGYIANIGTVAGTTTFLSVRVAEVTIAGTHTFLASIMPNLTKVTIGGSSMSSVEFQNAAQLAQLDLPQTVNRLVLNNTKLTDYTNFPCTISQFSNAYAAAQSVTSVDKCGVWWFYNNNTRVKALGVMSIGYFTTAGVKDLTYSNSIPQTALDTGDFYTFSNGTPTMGRKGLVILPYLAPVQVSYDSVTQKFTVPSVSWNVPYGPNFTIGYADFSNVTVLGDLNITFPSGQAIIYDYPASYAPVEVTGTLRYRAAQGSGISKTYADLSHTARKVGNLDFGENTDISRPVVELLSFAGCPTVTGEFTYGSSFTLPPSFSTFPAGVQINTFNLFVTRANGLINLSALPTSIVTFRFSGSGNFGVGNIPANVQNITLNVGVFGTTSDLSTLPATLNSLTITGTGLIRRMLTNAPCTINSISLPGLQSHERLIVPDRCGVWWSYSSTGRTQVQQSMALSIGYFDQTLDAISTTYTNSTPQKAADTGDFYTYANGVPTKVRDGRVSNYIHNNGYPYTQVYTLASYNSSKQLYVVNDRVTHGNYDPQGTGLTANLADCLLTDSLITLSYLPDRSNAIMPLLPREVQGDALMTLERATNFTGLPRVIIGSCSLEYLSISEANMDSLASNFPTYIGGNLLIRYSTGVDFGATPKTILGNISVVSLKNNSLIDSRVSSITSTNGKRLTVTSTGKIYEYNNGTYSLIN
jgi:hypothetical protein